jgi:single-stranded-DNA-specific exonuclease
MRFSWWTRWFGHGRTPALESARVSELEPRLDGFPVAGSLHAQALSRALGISVTVAGWLAQRGHSDAEATRRFLNPRLAELTSPDGMLDRKAAAERIARAVRAGERIVVFGDYDCDGMTSAAIFTEALRKLGADVTPVLASRFDGGYGFSAAALQRVLALQPGLLVTCDCGSSDHATLSLLRASNVDAVVVDHHLVPEQPLPVLAFLNPHRPGCGSRGWPRAAWRCPCWLRSGPSSVRRWTYARCSTWSRSARSATWRRSTVTTARWCEPGSRC